MSTEQPKQNTAEIGPAPTGDAAIVAEIGNWSDSLVSFLDQLVPLQGSMIKRLSQVHPLLHILAFWAETKN